MSGWSGLTVAVSKNDDNVVWNNFGPLVKSSDRSVVCEKFHFCLQCLQTGKMVNFPLKATTDTLQQHLIEKHQISSSNTQLAKQEQMGEEVQDLFPHQCSVRPWIQKRRNFVWKYFGDLLFENTGEVAIKQVFCSLCLSEKQEFTQYNDKISTPILRKHLLSVHGVTEQTTTANSVAKVTRMVNFRKSWIWEFFGRMTIDDATLVDTENFYCLLCHELEGTETKYNRMTAITNLAQHLERRHGIRAFSEVHNWSRIEFQPVVLQGIFPSWIGDHFVQTKESELKDFVFCLDCLGGHEKKIGFRNPSTAMLRLHFDFRHEGRVETLKEVKQDMDDCWIQPLSENENDHRRFVGKMMHEGGEVDAEHLYCIPCFDKDQKRTRFKGKFTPSIVKFHLARVHEIQDENYGLENQQVLVINENVPLEVRIHENLLDKDLVWRYFGTLMQGTEVLDPKHFFCRLCVEKNDLNTCFLNGAPPTILYEHLQDVHQLLREECIVDTAPTFAHCRFCATSEGIAPLDQIQIELARSLLALDIDPNDELSQSSCAACASRLLEINAFLTMTRTVDRQMRDRLAEAKRRQDAIEAKRRQEVIEAIEPVQISSRIKISRIECPHCKEMVAESRLAGHLRRKHQTGRLREQCTVCGARVLCLSDHMKVHNEASRTHVCSYCGAAFYKKSNLDLHLVRHTKVKRFRCELCPFPAEFRDKHELNRHMKRHFGSEEFQCEICPRKFFEKRILRNHQRSAHATADEMYKCDMCGKMLKTKTLLKHHFYTHTNQTPFTCTVCKESFNSTDKLFRHRNAAKHHSIRCKQCPDFCAPSKNTFIDHLATVHNVGAAQMREYRAPVRYNWAGTISL